MEVDIWELTYGIVMVRKLTASPDDKPRLPLGIHLLLIVGTDGVNVQVKASVGCETQCRVST